MDKSKPFRHVWRDVGVMRKRCRYCGMEKKLLTTNKEAAVYYATDGSIIKIGKKDIPPCVSKADLQIE